MPYDSPKTLRRRQRDTEAPKPRKRRAQRLTTWLTDAEWDLTCEFHIQMLNEKATAGHCDSAAAHARALVHSAVQRRATQLMGALGLRSVWKALDIAKHELLNTEVA